MAEPSGPTSRLDVSTAPHETDLGRARRARSIRRIAIGLLAIFVGLGAAGQFGARTRTTSARGGGYTLSVTFPSITRPGLAVRWSVQVQRPGGLGEELVIAATSAYFDLFDFNQFYPQPSGETSDGTLTIWTFDVPEGDTMRITMDGRLEPARQDGEEAITAILVGDEPVVQVRYRTVVMP